jgi:hypothetical protein
MKLKESGRTIGKFSMNTAIDFLEQQNTLYRYKAFGLNVASEIPLPELVESEDAPDVTIRFGDVPDRLNDVVISGTYFEANSKEVLFPLRSIAKYLVVDDQNVIVSPEQHADMNLVGLFLLPTAFVALLHLRGFLVLHGSVIDTDGGAVAFVGPSGAGKSSLAAAFAKRGYPVLADDKCAVAVQNGQVSVVSGFPQIKLKPDTIDQLQLDIDVLSKIHPQWDKYGVPINRSIEDIPRRLKSIYVLELIQRGESGSIRLVPLSGYQKLQALQHNSFGKSLAIAMNQTAQHFRLLSTTANQVKMIQVVRPGESTELNAVADHIENDFN